MVDEKLKIVDDLEKAKAVVNVCYDKLVEVVFFEPIAHNMSYAESQQACQEWVASNYPGHRGDVPLYHASALLHYGFGKAPNGQRLLRSCYCHNGASEPIVRLDEHGEREYVRSGGPKAENVYVAVILHPSGVLWEVNPGLELFKNYRTSYGPAYW